MLEAACILSGILTALMHVFTPNVLYLTMPPGILFIGNGLLWFWFEVDKQALKRVLTTFRGLVISMLSAIIWFCDIARVVLSGQHTYSWIIIIYDLCTWTTAIFFLLSIDCVHGIANWMRFISPASAVLNAVHNIMDCLEDTNPVLFEMDNGSITVQQIEISATIELILFCFTLMFAVPFDYHHRYFSITTEKVQRKQLLPHKDYGRDYTEIGSLRFNTRWFYRAIAVLGVIGSAMYIVTTSTSAQNQIGNLLVTTLFGVVVLTMIWKHFEWTICPRLLSTFRPCMLVLSVMIRVYASIQEIIWHSNPYSNINTLCFAVTYDLGILLLLTRDGMLVPYPGHFSVALAVIMFLLSLFNALRLQFYDQYPWPPWFLYLDKVAYYQVMMFSVLTLKCTVYDWKFNHFVLIRDSKCRGSKEAVFAELEGSVSIAEDRVDTGTRFLEFGASISEVTAVRTESS